jgi:flagellar hook-associated protein 2
MRINNNLNFNTMGGRGAAQNNSFASRQNTALINSFFGVNTPNAPGFGAMTVGLRKSASALRQSLSNMQGRGSKSPFGLSTATSANEDRLRINTVDANRLRNSNVRQLSVNIEQVATSQRNEGKALNSSASASASGFDVGAQQISITVDGKQFDINFNVSATDSNRDVQNRIATAVNDRKIGVTASVSANSSAGTSSLVFESSQTGISNAGQPNFTVSGSGSGGTALSVLGGDTVTTEAQNARFRVNRGSITGALQTSRSNNVDLGFGINAQLRQTGTVAVNATSNQTGQINAFRDMVNKVNDLIDAARGGNNSARGNSRLEREIAGLVSANSGALARIGISMNSGGYMDIDEKRMEQAAQSGELERFASRENQGSGFGFVNRLSRMSDNVNRRPQAFVNTGFSQNEGINFNARQTARFNRMLGVGMMFDMGM